MGLISVEEYTQFPLVPADERVSYGADDSQFIDLFLPAVRTRPLPVVLLFHGGCWRAQHGLAQLGQMARALAEQGIAVFNLEYRRLGNGGGWPQTFLDVCQAADFVKSMAGPAELDVTRIVAVGHSAGGHLALWLACRPKLRAGTQLHSADPLRISSVVSLAGIPDLDQAVAQNICRGAPQELLGGLPNEFAERYAAGSPHHFLPVGVPHIHIIGAKDWIVPPAYVRDFVKQSTHGGDTVTLTTIPDTGHFEIVSATSQVWPIVEQTVLEQCGL